MTKRVFFDLSIFFSFDRHTRSLNVRDGVGALLSLFYRNLKFIDPNLEICFFGEKNPKGNVIYRFFERNIHCFREDVCSVSTNINVELLGGIGLCDSQVVSYYSWNEELPMDSFTGSTFCVSDSLVVTDNLYVIRYAGKIPSCTIYSRKIYGSGNSCDINFNEILNFFNLRSAELRGSPELHYLGGELLEAIENPDEDASSRPKIYLTPPRKIGLFYDPQDTVHRNPQEKRYSIFSRL